MARNSGAEVEAAQAAIDVSSGSREKETANPDPDIRPGPDGLTPIGHDRRHDPSRHIGIDDVCVLAGDHFRPDIKVGPGDSEPPVFGEAKYADVELHVHVRIG